MFGIDVEKLAIIGAVALVVIGPERLPFVARTLGTLLGRAQRYLADVRAEVTREMQLDELHQMRDSVRSAAQAMSTSIQSTIDQTRGDILSTVAGVKDAVTGAPAATALPTASSPAPELSPAKRNKWRRNRLARRSATPVWYRQTQRRRTRVLSAAARVARYRVRQGTH